MICVHVSVCVCFTSIIVVEFVSLITGSLRSLYYSLVYTVYSCIVCDTAPTILICQFYH